MLKIIIIIAGINLVMPLQKAVNNLCAQLASTIERLSPTQYSMPCKTLTNNTIGQHVRHIIELFQTLEKGYQDSLVNYDLRKRDTAIETNRDLALELLNNIHCAIAKPNKDMTLQAQYDRDSASVPLSIATNYYREVAFNLEHTIHHMALIRVGVNEVSEIILPEDFGLAPSTIKHRKQCAQ